MHALVFITGVIIGLLISIFVIRKKPVGTIQIDRSNEFSSGPYLFLELYNDPRNLYSKKTATFDILLEDLDKSRK